MSNKTDLQNLLQQIHKLASPPPPPPTGYRPASGAATVNVPHTDASVNRPSVGYHNPAIKAMQQELIDLAKSAAPQLNLQDLVSADPKKQREAVNQDAFGNFVTKHYLRSLDVPSVEFSPDPKKVSVQLSHVMDTMQRVGNPKNGEFVADGVWGPKTNAALHNAYALASGLLQMAKDFKLPITAYRDENLEQLKPAIVEDPKAISVLKKIELAPKITPHLKAIQRLYNEIKNNMLAHPDFKQHIQEDLPFQSYQTGSALAPQQLESLKNNPKYSNGFAVTVGPNHEVQTKIDVANLSSKDALQNWAQRAAPSTEINLVDVVDQVMKQAFGGPGY